MTNYQRTPEELKDRAVLYWPSQLDEREKGASIIPKLLNTQEKFISILDVSDSAPDSWIRALKATKEMPANLFLKHLMILSDIAGENLKRLCTDFKNIFPKGLMTFIWKQTEYRYRYLAMLDSKLSNKALFVDGVGLQTAHEINRLIKDTIMLVLHGASSISPIPNIIKDRCIIGSMMGDKERLEKFVKQRYIWVSRITGGATSNMLGQIAQDYVYDILAENLPEWKIVRNGTIPGISQNAGQTDISFDIVAHSPENKWVAIEVGFQFTTNSVIERKAGQSEARLRLLHHSNHKIAYVIDGAGNFERIAALTTICKNSDCTVAFSPEEINVLVEFLRTKL